MKTPFRLMPVRGALLALAALAALIPASSFGAVLIDYRFDGGTTNNIGPAAQVVENDLDDLIAGSANTSTGLIRTGQRSDSNTPYIHAIGFNSSGTVNLSTFAGFTATFTVDSISLTGGIEVTDLLANGMFFGVVSGANATGTAGTSLWNNQPQAIGYVPGSNSWGDHQFAMNTVSGSGNVSTTALTTTQPANAEFLNGFTVSISVFNNNTWQISSTGLGNELNQSGSLAAGIDYATFAQGVGLYTSLQGRQNSDLDMGRMTLTAIPEPGTALLAGLGLLAALRRRR